MRITESESKYKGLDQMSTKELLVNINTEDKSVPLAVERVIPAIEELVECAYQKMKKGGRLFYLGSGTSGRLGIVDASECPPTFGVEAGRVVGIIAGGDHAIRKAREFAEDDPEAGWKDLQNEKVSHDDFVIGISASGRAPYVYGALKQCQNNEILTACISSNPDSPLEEVSDYPVICVTGSEFVSGSTRMKAGTAQKLILNMISTSLMIKLGHVLDNRMVDMQLSNNKLIERGTLMLMNSLGWTEEKARSELLKEGSVRKVLVKMKKL